MGNCLREIWGHIFCDSDVEIVFIVVTHGAGGVLGREEVDQAGGLGRHERGHTDPQAHRGGGVDGGGGGRAGQD